MVEPQHHPDIHLELLSQARFLAAIRAMISSIAHRLGFNDACCGQISLAVDEALCNVINHGYQKKPDGRIWISIWANESEPCSIRIVIEDRARQVRRLILVTSAHVVSVLATFTQFRRVDVAPDVDHP